MMSVAILFMVGQRKKVTVVTGSLIIPNMAAVGSSRTGGESTNVECHYIYPNVITFGQM